MYARYLFFFAVLFMLGCNSVPKFTKAEIFDEESYSFEKAVNYRDLADYWDTNAQKFTLDFAPVSFMKVSENKKKVEITVGNGPYYFLMELRALEDNRTLVTVYDWGAYGSAPRKWIELVRNAPEPL